MTHHLIYIPGLGDGNVDKRTNGQRLATLTWKFWGVQPHIFQMNWADSEAFEPKFNHLLALIDELSKQGTVSLIGASAGATVVINAFAARKNDINGVVCIAGKINNPQAIGKGYKQRNPSFWESAHQTPASLNKLDTLDRRRILSLRAMLDLIVPARDSILKGAHNRPVITSGHAFTIATQLIFGAPSFIKFLNQQKKQP